LKEGKGSSAYCLESARLLVALLAEGLSLVLASVLALEPDVKPYPPYEERALLALVAQVS
jgi:hypothetical protein